MQSLHFPVIDPRATGLNILALRKARGLTVRDVQEWFSFEEPRAIYKWQTGQTLPSLDNFYALSHLLLVPMDRILIPVTIQTPEPRADARGFIFCRFFASAPVVY